MAVAAATLKVYHNGIFETYSIGNISSVKNTEGTFNRINDSMYTETIARSGNAYMNGKTYNIKYKITGNTLTISGEFDGMRQDGTVGMQRYIETWKKLNFPQ